MRRQEQIAKEKTHLLIEDKRIQARDRPRLAIEQCKDLQSSNENANLEKDAILVVDDIDADLDKLTKFLSELHLPVYGATNKEDALKILRQYPINILVTDIVLPMYRLTHQEYKEWIETYTTSHRALKAGGGIVREEVTRTKMVEEETEDYSEFAGFKLLDEARRLLPWLPVIIVSRYANLEMARHAIGSKVQDILSKQIHLDNSAKLLESVRKNMVPICERIADLGRERLLEFLESASEQTVTLKTLVPLFHKLGYHGIRYTHGTNECGLDLIFYDVDRLGIRRYVGAQVKAEKIHKSIGEPPSQSIIAILQQVQQAFESTLYMLPEKMDLQLDRIFVISSKSITRDARDYIRKALMGKVYSQHIEFWDKENIVDRVLKTLEPEKH